MAKSPATGSTEVIQSLDDQGQLALALFDELSPKELRISDSPTEVGFNRANIFLDLDGISLSGRRAIDVAYFIVAQGDSKHRYYSRQKNREYVTYVVDLEFFKWLMGYTSNNRDHLRSVLRQGQKAAVEVMIENEKLFLENNNDKESKDTKIVKRDKKSGNIDQWVAVPLMGAVGFNQGYVHFQIHEQLEPHIRNPRSFHFLDLRYIFDTLRGRILFDRLQPHIENGVTPWFELDELRVTLESDTKLYRTYKYFKARILVKAIEDINKNTDLEIESHEMLEPGSSRKVASLRFIIKRKSDHFNRAHHLTRLTDRYTALIEEFGLNQKQIQSVIKFRKEFSDERIENAIEYTRFQLKMGKIKTSPSGYLMKAIEEGYALGSAMQSVIDQNNTPPSPKSYQQNKSPSSATKTDDELKQKSDAGIRKLKSLPKAEQNELLSKYLGTMGARVAASGDQVELKSIVKIEDVLRTPILARDFGFYIFNHKMTKKS